jgi:hypothetical protein
MAIYISLYWILLIICSALGIFVPQILINIEIEMPDVILCEHQKNNFFCQDVTMREDLLSGINTMSQERQ